MSNDLPEYTPELSPVPRAAEGPILAEVITERAAAAERRDRSVSSSRLPLILFSATCLTTFWAGSKLQLGILNIANYVVQTGTWPERIGLSWPLLFSHLADGLLYSICVMTILGCHEMGHYLQARRYGVPASLPYFVPMPWGPLGTLGAVIGMRPGVGDRKAIFDIGISGPLAGLVPTLIFCVVGLWQAHHAAADPRYSYGDPLILQFLVWCRWGTLPPGHDVILNPMLFAGWVGLLITSLNLIPIGQLDGGHVLYALLRKKAHRVASFLLIASAAAVAIAAVVYHYPMWILMVVLLFLMDPAHPPTADDSVPLGAWRVVLGWLTLAFVFIGFTPAPFPINF